MCGKGGGGDGGINRDGLLGCIGKGSDRMKGWEGVCGGEGRLDLDGLLKEERLNNKKLNGCEGMTE